MNRLDFSIVHHHIGDKELQLLNVPRALARKYQSGPVVELQLPPIPRLAVVIDAIAAFVTHLATSPSPSSASGVVRCDRRLPVRGHLLGVSKKDLLFAYSGYGDLLSRVIEGWNGFLMTFQVIPYEAHTPRVDEVHESKAWDLTELYQGSSFFISCAHDGEVIQVVSTKDSVESLDERIRLAASATGATLLPGD